MSFLSQPDCLKAQLHPAAFEAASFSGLVLSHDQIREMINASVTSAFTSGRYNNTAFSASVSSLSPSSWFLDSGASNDMTSIDHYLHDTKPYIGHE